MDRFRDVNTSDDLWQELGFNNVIYNRSNAMESVIVQIADNLEHTLNARYRWGEEISHSRLSHLLSFGFTELFYFNPGSNGQCQQLCQALQAYIHINEPRLKNIEVELEETESSQFRVCFKIRGVLQYDLEKSIIQLTSIFRLDHMKFRVHQEKL